MSTEGGTAHLIAASLEGSGPNGREFHLFDTFEGMPETASGDPSWLIEGQFNDTSLDSVKNFLKGYKFISYHKGFIPNTFSGLEDKSFSFVHIDVDLYQSTIDCLEFFYERVVAGGLIVFDDYGYITYKYSERKAADDFLADRPEKPICLPTGQAFLIKV